MPYISENGQTRFVTQEEYNAWARGQGLPTTPLRGGTANGNFRPAAGGTDLAVSGPVDTANLTSRQRRDLVLQQERQVDEELAGVDAKLAQASTGKIQLSSAEIAALERRKSDLADAANQLADGRPVTNGVLNGGRTTENIILPNTTVNTPADSLPQVSQRTSEVTEISDTALPSGAVDQDVPTISATSTPVEDPFAEEPTAFVDQGDFNVLPEDVPAEQQGNELVSLNTGEVFGIDNEGFADVGGLNVLPEDIAIDQQGDELVDLNTGEVLGIDAETGFVDQGGLLVSPEDLNSSEDPFVEEGGLLEFTPNGAQVRSPAEVEAIQKQALLDQARRQQTIAQQRKTPNNGDWRVKLRLAPQASYLYKASNPGILQPLAETDGIIFPYMPTIDTQYRASYSNYDLTHSNYRGYFYQNSYVDAINLRCTFTAQSTAEANYLLATIHFLRSVTKMFYGQDDASIRGAPPPLVYLTGLGEYQFNEHSCLVSAFNYSLPSEVDYIRARSPNINNTNLINRRQRATTVGGGLLGNLLGGALTRLSNAGAPKGGIPTVPPPPTLGKDSPTYVPTKMEIAITLLPVQSRQQVSQQFSVKQFASGDLLKGGFW